MSYCPHPHVWELNGHAQCSVCYEIVACPVQLECNHLRAQLHDLQQRTNAHAKSWEALVESERKRGAVDAAAKERDTRAEKEGLLAQLEQARAQGGEASRRAASGEKELATCSNQLACIREGAKTLSAERDRLRRGARPRRVVCDVQIVDAAVAKAKDEEEAAAHKPHELPPGAKWAKYCPVSQVRSPGSLESARAPSLRARPFSWPRAGLAQT